MALEPFMEKHADRFFNIGVAEQNMVGIATGLAESGFIPFVYSIVTFATLRPYEFIRNGPVWHRLPVRIVGVGGGFEYGAQGLSHHGLEDVGVMRVQPGMTVVAPADHEQMATALRATWNADGPVYYRIGKDDKTGRARTARALPSGPRRGRARGRPRRARRDGIGRQRGDGRRGEARRSAGSRRA
jgi:transketolase